MAKVQKYTTPSVLVKSVRGEKPRFWDLRRPEPEVQGAQKRTPLFPFIPTQPAFVVSLRF